MKNKQYAISLDLTVWAPDEKTAWVYAEALSEHLDDGITSCHECKNKYAHCSQECGNISEPDLLCDKCMMNMLPEEAVDTTDNKTVCPSCHADNTNTNG